MNTLPEDLLRELTPWLNQTGLMETINIIKPFRKISNTIHISLTVKGKNLHKIKELFPLITELEVIELDNDDQLFELIGLNLLKLDLSYCKRLTNKGLEYISRISSIKSLDLHYCYKITDDGLKYISKLKQLISLNLSLCVDITDDGLEYISQLELLKSLDLTFCEHITDIGLKYISQLNQLNTLNIYYCFLITDKGLEYISKNVKIFRNKNDI